MKSHSWSRTAEAMRVSLAEEVGETIRAAIAEWPKTLRLISLFVAMTGPLAMIVLLVMVQRR